MHIKPEQYVFDLTFHSKTDVWFLVAALRGACREWAACSNDGAPLSDLAHQIESQLPGGVAIDDWPPYVSMPELGRGAQ